MATSYGCTVPTSQLPNNANIIYQRNAQ